MTEATAEAPDLDLSLRDVIGLVRRLPEVLQSWDRLKAGAKDLVIDDGDPIHEELAELARASEDLLGHVSDVTGSAEAHLAASVADAVADFLERVGAEPKPEPAVIPS